LCSQACDKKLGGEKKGREKVIINMRRRKKKGEINKNTKKIRTQKKNLLAIF
jgi:hypothetical protein